jgi:hypothetical protein
VRHNHDGGQSHFHHFIIPTTAEFGAQTTLHQLLEEWTRGANGIAPFVRRGHRVQVHDNGLRVHDGHGHSEGLRKGGYEHRWMHHYSTLSQKWFGLLQDFGRQKNDGRGTVAHFFIGGTRQFQHAFGSGMGHVNFAQNGVSIIREQYRPHGINEHFEHAPRTERGANDIGHGLGRGNIGQLRLTTRLTLGVLIYIYIYIHIHEKRLIHEHNCKVSEIQRKIVLKDRNGPPQTYLSDVLYTRPLTQDHDGSHTRRTLHHLHFAVCVCDEWKRFSRSVVVYT